MITALLECGPQGFGFTVEGSRPCKLNVLENSVASLNGVRSGDILVAIDNVNLEKADHTKIVEYLRRNVRKRQMLITFRHVDHHNTSTINARSSIFKKHTGNKSRRSIDVSARASTVSLSDDNDKSFGTFLRRMNPLTPQRCRRRCSIHRVDLTSTSDRLTSGTPFKVLSNSINLDVDEQFSLVSVFVTRFIAKTTYPDNNDSSFTVDKTVAGFDSQTFSDYPLAVLRIYEMKVIVQLDNSPSLFCFPYQSIVDAAISRTNDSVFGIISRATDANKSYFCFAFYVDTQLCDHSVHSAFTERNGLKCRAGINPAREDCDIFPYDCHSIVTALHYIIPPATDDSSTICSALNETQNSTVSKFLRKFGKHNGGKANDSLFALTNETKAVNLDDDDGSTIIDFANSSTSDDEIQKEIDGDYLEMRPPTSLITNTTADPDHIKKSNGEGSASCANASFHLNIPSRQQRDKLHSAKSPRTFSKKDANDLSNLSCNSRRRVDGSSIVGSHFSFAPTKRPKHKKEDFKEKVSLTSENSNRAPSPEVKKFTKKRKVTAALLAGAAQQRFLQLRRRSVARQPQSPSQCKTSSNIDSTDFPHKEGKSAANAPFCTFNEEEVSELLSSRQSQNQECASGPLHQFATVSSHGVLVQTSDEGEKKGSRKSKRGNRHFTKDTSPSSSTDCVVSKKSVDKENRNPDIINSSPQHTKVATEPHMPGNSGGGGGGTVLNIDKTDIEQVLKSEIARAPFQQFLQQQFCSENINFYLAVEEYRAIPESEVERRADFGRLIFERHFASNCIEPVNIDNSTANSIRTAYKENKFSGDLYDVVQYQIFHLLKYDCWPRYLRAGIQGSEDYGGDGSSRSHADSIASTSARGQNFTTYESISKRRGGRKSLFRFMRRLNNVDSPVETHVSTLRNRNVESNENAQRSNEIENLTRPYSQTSTSYSSDESNIDFTDSGCNTSSSLDEPKYCIDTGSKSTREPPSDFPLKTCTLLRADVATEITLFDQLQSVKQWAVATAEAHGLDKNATEVVDAQTGSTIDPARQAVDALNNRTVRIMPVVKFPVVFLASSTAAKPSPPIPAKVVILRARTALTVGKTIRPMMSKYNVDPEQAVVCISGTCEVIKLPTPVSQIYQKSLTVMSEQQFAERKLLPKREYQKELALVPTWMTASNPDQGLPFHQHGDVGFCEISIEAEGKGLKHNATRSYSSSREFFKFGRKPSQAKSGRLDHDPSGGGSPSEFGAHLRNPLLNRGSDRRKSVGSTASPNASSAAQKPTTSGAASQHRPSGPSVGAALAVGLVAPQDIPYCGENEPEPVITSDVLTPYTTAASSAKHEVLYPTKSAISSSASSFSSSSSFTTARQSLCCEIPDFLKKTDIPNSSSSMTAQTSGANGSMPCIPPLFTSTVRSDKDSAMTPTEVIESGLAWQKADYV